MWCKTCKVFQPYTSEKARCISCGAPLRLSADDLLGDSPKRIVQEIRPAQVRMAQAVEEAIQTEKNLVAEAGTGTGKSFAVIIPAILSGKRVVVSTATTLLQHQYAEHVLPTLGVSLGNLGYDVRFAVAKGKRHYLCPQLFRREKNNFPKPKTAEDAKILKTFLEWCKSTETGERQELDDYLKPLGAVTPWYFSKVSAEDCTGAKNCAFANACGYVRARARVKDAQVVIANHAIVGIDIRLGHRLLPAHDIYIIDEAHKAEDYFRNVFSSEVSEKAVPLLQRYIEHRDIVPAEEPFEQIFKELDAGNRALFRKIRSRQLSGDKSVIAPEVISDEVNNICKWLGELAAPMNEEYQKVLKEDSSLVNDLGIDKETIIACEASAERGSSGRALDWDVESGLLMLGISRVERLRQRLEALVQPTEASILYVEDTHREKSRYKLVRAPVFISEILQHGLYPTMKTVVQTSATLSIAGDFSFFKETMGLAPDTSEFIVPSPFDYERYALLYLPKHLPLHPRNDPTCADKEAGLQDYFEALAKEITRLVKASKGGAFILCSSRSEMTELFERTRDRVKFPCRVQEPDVSTGSLESWFREEKNPVLFATKSFWEGVSIEGKQLRLVVIPKVPFPSPTDPVLKAKEKAIKERGGNAFMQLSFPVMAMDILQGFGRLIRTMSDFGVAALLDTRAVPGAPRSKAYANKLRRTLPFIKETEKIEVVRQAFEILEAKHGPF